MDTSTTELISPRGIVRPEFIYACKYRTNQLHRMSLLTGEHSCHQIPGYQFKNGSRWSELPGGILLITGGTPAVKEVMKIDTSREWAVSAQPPMLTARLWHAAVYHSQYLYVLGGYSDRQLRECERYVCAESRWEVLPALPVAGYAMSAVVLDDSLYALGGRVYGGDLDTVQKLSLDSRTWELMQLKLPQTAKQIPCFKTESQIYLVIKKTLYSFTPLQVKPVTTPPQGSSMYNTSYYSRGTLYYSVDGGIGSLSVEE
jgi:hypothetical protein